MSDPSIKRPPTGPYAAAALIGMLAVGATLLAGLAVLAVGMAYNPDLKALYVKAFAALVAVVGVTMGAILYRMRTRPFSPLISIVAAAVGMLLLIGGVVSLMGDPGDALLYAGPVIMGGSLVVLAFEPKGELEDVL